MGIKQFKDIIDDKGYLLSANDRKIFERELSKSLFGLDGTHWYRHGKTDVIEFIIYDSNNNQLPQGEFGKLVRYIYLDDKNIRSYFMISDVPDVAKKNESRRYVIDAEKLIKEAGYTDGIFKTQVTLLNRRVGSENIPFDRLWIHEISPSRTEIRVLPVMLDDDKTVLEDLSTRYNIYVNEKEFRDDTIIYVEEFIENLNIQTVLENFLKIKGNVSDGQTYIDLINAEFGIKGFDIFLNTIKEKYMEAMHYYLQNRVYDINSLEYGNIIEEVPPIDLAVEDIKNTALTTLHNVIDYCLPKRNIIQNSILSKEDQVTADEVNDILKSISSDSIYESTLPQSVTTIVRGCMNVDALNYNPLAKEDDGSCVFTTSPIKNVATILGCTNRKAVNYNPLATQDDGTCKFFEESYTTTKTYYIWSTTGRINYFDSSGARKWSGVEYDSITITYNTGEPLELIGDIRSIPKPKEVKFIPTDIVISPIQEVQNFPTINTNDNLITTYPSIRLDKTNLNNVIFI